MQRLGILIASFLVSFSVPSFALAETITQEGAQATNLGLYGGEVRDIAVDSTNGIIAITTYSPNGVFISSDGGTTWSGLPDGMDVGEARGVEMDEDGNIFMLTADGLFESTDHGVSWTEHGEEEIGNYSSLMTYANGILFVARTDGQVTVSTDGGETFTNFTVTEDSTFYATSIASSADGTTLYAVFSDQETYVLYTSADSGETWEVVDTSEITTGLGLIAVDPIDPLHLIVTAAVADESPWRSTDGGATWTELEGGSPAASAITFDSSGREYFGVEYTDDAGATWDSLNDQTPTSRVSGIVVADPSDDNILYAGSFAAFAVSTDRGETWTDANTGITAVRVNSMSQSADKNTVWAATNAGLAKTTNFTDENPTWEFPIYYDSYPSSVWVNPETPDNVVVGGMSAVYVTTNGGDDWTTATGVNSDYTVNMIVTAPDSTTTLYATSSYHNYTEVQAGDVYMSTDGGLTWTSLEFPEEAATQAISVANDGTLYVGTGELDLSAEDAVTGIYTYDGTTWTHLENSPEDEITAVLVDPTDNTVIYATAHNFNTGGDSSAAGLYRSTDSGETWEQLTSGLEDAYRFTALSMQPNARTLYVAGTIRDGGAGVIYKSTNAGDSWDLYYTGLQNETFNYLLFDGLIAGNSRGAYDLHSHARLRLKAEVRRAEAGTRISLKATLKDAVTDKALKGKKVKIYRKKNGSWIYVKSVETNNKGVAHFHVKLNRKTKFRARWNPRGAAAEEFVSAHSLTVQIGLKHD